MKTFKQFDIIFSTALILLFAVLTAIRQDFVFITGYCVIGGWQLVSMVIHIVNGWFTSKGTARYVYHRIVAVLFCLTAVSMAFPFLMMVILYIMLFAAPVMAVIYTVICRNEYILLKHRALTQLK